MTRNTSPPAAATPATPPATLPATTATPDTNYHPQCAACGSCCKLTILCVSAAEVERIKDYARQHNIRPRNNGPECCPFLKSDNRCAVYPVRAQTCRLHNCKIPRKQLLAQHPEIEIDDTKPLIDLRQTFPCAQDCYN